MAQGHTSQFPSAFRPLEFVCHIASSGAYFMQILSSSHFEFKKTADLLMQRIQQLSILCKQFYLFRYRNIHPIRLLHLYQGIDSGKPFVFFRDCYAGFCHFVCVDNFPSCIYRLLQGNTCHIHTFHTHFHTHHTHIDVFENIGIGCRS